MDHVISVTRRWMLMELWLEETDNRWKENDASSARQRGSSGSNIGCSRREKKMQQRARENAGAAARFAAIRLLAVEQEEAGMRFKQFLERRACYSDSVVLETWLHQIAAKLGESEPVVACAIDSEPLPVPVEFFVVVHRYVPGVRGSRHKVEITTKELAFLFMICFFYLGLSSKLQSASFAVCVLLWCALRDLAWKCQ